MILRMALPWKHPKFGTFHLRQRAPRDLLPKLKGKSLTLPVGDSHATIRINDIIQVSLDTKEATVAKERHAVADAALKRFFSAQRSGATSLNHRQILALAGLAYKDLTGLAIDEPGKPELWFNVMRLHVRARSTGKLSEWIGPSVDAILQQEALVVDDNSRNRLIEAVDDALYQANFTLLRAAQGDYSPDPSANRFPDWTPVAAPQAPEEKPQGISLNMSGLLDKWMAYQGKMLAPNTLKRYSGSLRSLVAFLKGKDIKQINDNDIYAWAEHRQNVEGVSAAVINKNDLVAASSLFRWAAGRSGGRLLASNPVSGVRLDEPRKAPTRERTFRSDELKAILKAALNVKIDPDYPARTYAFRWCPWIAAYSGARISEITGLEASDIRKENGVPVMVLRNTKGDKPRTVPLHPHLIEQGFLDYVRSVGHGPLFYDPTRHGKNAKTPPREICSRKVATWVREEAGLNDFNVDPNHGWRHTWKTTALGAGIEERLRDAITGHSVASVGRRYETPPVAMLAEAMERFPRYEIGMAAGVSDKKTERKLSTVLR